MRNRSVLWGVGLMVVLALPGCKRSEEPVDEGYGTAGAEATATPEPAAGGGQAAAAQLAGPSGITGVVNFTAAPGGGVQAVVRIEGAAPGQHGLHLHAAGLCEPPDFASAGDHFNPTNAQHGGPQSAQRHAGDFGNVEVAADGTGNADVAATDLTIEGPNGVVGKAVVLHEKVDDLTTQPSGNSGGRVACGVVQTVELTAPAAEATPTVSQEGAI
jgi:superoxide dismutase, Cu-Zn family